MMTAGLSRYAALVAAVHQRMQRPDVRRSAGDVIWKYVTGRGSHVAVVDQRERPAGLFAPAHLEAEGKSSRDVVAGEPGPGRHVAGAPVGSGFDHGQADAGDQAALIGDHQIAARSQDTDEFGQHGLKGWDVDQGEHADHEVDVVVGQWQVMQVGFVELAVGHLRACACSFVR
jgi:hypothetical protein